MEEQAKRLLLVTIIILITGLQLFAPSINEFKFSVTKYTESIVNKNTSKLRQEALERFLDDLGARESSNNWKVYNKYGYIGEWQLGKSVLKEVGYKHILFRDFKKNPYIFSKYHQTIAVKRLIELNTNRLRPYIDKYEGTVIKGIEVTKSGIIAGAHLGGSRGVKRFLDSRGRLDPKDALGTPLSLYIKKFSNYNF